MTANEVREVLETELGGPFTETTWKRFYKDDVEYFLEHQSPEAWQSLKEVAEDLFAYEKELIKELASGVVTERGARRRRLGQRKSGKKGAAEEHWFPDLSPETKLRAEVYGEYLAKVAAADYFVARYREEVFSERTTTLTSEQAHSLVRSSAAQALPLSFFHEMRIPVGDHHVEVLHYEPDVIEDDSVRDYATIRVRWSENRDGIEKRMVSDAIRDKDLAWLEFRNEEGEDDYMAVRQDSVLGELQRLATSLTERFPWREAQATWFILTGDPPLVSPAKAAYTLRPAEVHLGRFGDTRTFEHAEVSISAVPWVPEKIVAEAFFNLQSRILPGEQNRQLGRRGLEVLRFVIQKENPIELTQARRRRIGKELVEAWNRKYPHWSYDKYKQPTSVFWDAYNDAEESVLQPSWTHPRKVSEVRIDK